MVCRLGLMVLFLFTALQTKAQAKDVSSAGKVPVFGTWIGPEGEYLELQQNKAFVSIGYRHRETFLEVSDTLLTMNGAPAIESGKTVDRSNAREDFKVLRLTKDTLVIQARNTAAISVFKTPRPIIFVNRDFYIRQAIDFHGLIYTCSGDATQEKAKKVKLAIDEAGGTKFWHAAALAHNAEPKISKLAAAQLDSLNFLLRQSALDRFSMPRTTWSTAAIYTFRISYNSTTVNAGGQVIPYAGTALKTFLDQICIYESSK